MLNNDALAELSKLKKIIEDSKDGGEGIVVGSQGRYGFVKLDDGRSIYLPPEEMQRVLPGDRVQVEVTTNDKNKSQAKLEKLLQKNLKHFVGNYTIKGNNHFVIPDQQAANRGLFVPPKERKNFAHGDLVQCQLVRHPFADGKSQVKITELIGKPDDIGIEHRLIELNYQLSTDFEPAAHQQAQQIAAQLDALDDGNRQDLSYLPFVTIDAESTLDLDDALLAESNDKGWTVYSAIADPSAFVETGSPLDRAARQRASSVYFPGKVLSMLPTALATDGFSLNPEQRRPVLICKMTVAHDGTISHYEFFNALIRSHAKFSYTAVADYIDNAKAISSNNDLLQSLSNLKDFAKARREYRLQHCLIQDDNADYSYQLDDQLKIQAITLKATTSAHRVVEETMLATNLCAGEEFAKHPQCGALFSTHSGFRPERIQEIQQLLKLEKPDYPSDNLDSFEGYTGLIQSLDQDLKAHPLKIILRRLLQGAEITTQALPHCGLGFRHYALITSPIRRYQDLHNHRILKKILTNRDTQTGEVNLQAIQEKITAIRSAQRELIQRLLCQYLQDKVGQTFAAKIMAVSSQGLALRLVDTGAESFVQLRNGPKLKTKYDSIRLTLTVNESLYQLDQVTTVKLESVNRERNQLQFSLT
jgi:VacB/RNase II family 3'-5' exoribonuclease